MPDTPIGLGELHHRETWSRSATNLSLAVMRGFPLRRAFEPVPHEGPPVHET